MNLWSEIESGSDIPDVVTAVIEVPNVAPIKLKEPLMINCGTTTTIGVVTSTKKKEY